MPMRWRWPPENSCGKRSACSGGSPTRSSRSRTRALDVAATGHAVQFHRLADDLAHALAGIQRRVGILEDHLHLAPNRSELAPVPSDEFLAAEPHRARGRRRQLQDGPTQRRLSATGFADQAQCLTLVEGEAHAVHRPHPADLAVDEDARLDREVLDEVGHLEQWRRPSQRHRLAQADPAVDLAEAALSDRRPASSGHGPVAADRRTCRTRAGSARRNGSRSAGGAAMEADPESAPAVRDSVCPTGPTNRAVPRCRGAGGRRTTRRGWLARRSGPRTSPRPDRRSRRPRRGRG